MKRTERTAVAEYGRTMCFNNGPQTLDQCIREARIFASSHARAARYWFAYGRRTSDLHSLFLGLFERRCARDWREALYRLEKVRDLAL